MYKTNILVSWLYLAIQLCLVSQYCGVLYAAENFDLSLQHRWKLYLSEYTSGRYSLMAFHGMQGLVAASSAYGSSFTQIVWVLP